MKKVILPLLILILFSSCNQDDKDPAFDINGTWDLVQIRSSWTLESIEEEELGFVERYIFNSDGTFIKYSEKSRGSNQEETPLQALGSYEIRPSEYPLFLFDLTLIFETGSELAVSCNSDTTEELNVTLDKALVNTSWMPCDGPGFMYQKGK